MKMSLVLATLTAALLTQVASASCPDIEGKYQYRCTLMKDDDAQLAKVLETSGEMLVQQTGCEGYRFTETSIPESHVIDLNEMDSAHAEAETIIKWSSLEKLRFKTIAWVDSHTMINSLLGEFFVTKGSIRKTKSGFVLKGKERSSFMALFSDKHSKFSCRFEEI